MSVISALKDGLVVGTGCLAMLAANPVAWSFRLLKTAVFGAILFGTAITMAQSVPEIISAQKPNASTWIYATALATELWLPLLGFALAASIGSIGLSVRNIERICSHSRTASVALASYFESEVETDSMRNIRDKGYWSTVRENISMSLAFALIPGMEPLEDGLTARAVRYGQRTTFREELNAKSDETIPSSD